jgi:hypothetical protein
MKIISLSANKAGFACAVATSIKKYSEKIQCPTQFFDYLVCDLADINIILNKNTSLHVLDTVDIQPCTKKSIVSFKNFNNLISYHDLNNCFSKEEFDEFQNKYRRRYDRLLKLIQKEDILFFIRYGKEKKEELQEIITNTQLLNTDVVIRIINVFYDNTKSYPEDNNDNIIYINFYLFEDNNITYDSDNYYKTLQFKWNIVFQVIEEYTKKIIAYKEKGKNKV